MTKELNSPRLRFKKEDGSDFPAWEQRKLGEVSSKVLEKNRNGEIKEVFTNSAEYGIICQRDFFEHDVARQDSIDKYYVVRPEDFVYNPRISVSAPVGPVSRNRLKRIGVVSPLYRVFRPIGLNNDFLEQFFKTSYWHAYMRFYGDTGARSDRFAIKDELFFKLPIPFPSQQEQKAIGMVLRKMDDAIALHQRKLEKMQLLKKSLLQQMFV